MYTDVTHTALDVQKHIKRQFGDEAAVQISDEDIIRWINAGQFEIFRRTEPVKSSMTASSVALQATYSFPGEVLRVQSIRYNNAPVKQLSSQEAEEYVLENDPLSTATGAPEIWYEWGGSFTFYPAPDTTGLDNILIQFVKRPAEIADANDPLSVPDAYYNRLIEYVLQQAYELDENFTASELKGSQFSQNLESSGGRGNVVDNTYPTITVLEEDL